MTDSRALSLLVKFAALDRLTGPLAKIRGGSKQTSAAIADTRREIGNLQRAQARIGAFKALEQRMRADGAALDQARAKVAALKEQIATATGPTAKLATSLGRAEGQVRKLSDRIEGQGTELQDLSRKLEAAGIDVANLGRHEDRLGLKLLDANRKLKQQEDQLARNAAASEKLQKAQSVGADLRGKGAGAIAGGIAMSAPLIASAKSAGDFQSSMTDIAQKADLTRAAGEEMGRSLDALGPKVAQLPSQLAEGVDALAGFGLDPKQAMKMIEPIGRAATAYKAEVLDLSKATFSSVDNLKVPVGQTAKVLDVMAQAGKDGAFEVKDMAQYFPELTASAAGLGQKGVPAVADLAAALQITRKGAGDSASAANNLQNLLAKINTEDTIKNFKEFGVDLPAAMKKAAKDGKTPIEAIAELTNKATKGDLSKISFLFGDMQVQQALRPLIQNIDLYRQIRERALAANGTVEKDFAERMDDANAKMSKAGAVAQAFGHRVGATLLPYVSAAADKLSAVVEAAGAWADRNPELFGTLVKVAAAIAAIVVVGGALALALGTILGPFAYLRFALAVGGPQFLAFGKFMLWPLRIIPKLLGGIWGLARGIFAAGAFLIANPIVAVILAIVAALAFAGYMIWKHWDTIKGAFTAAGNWLAGMAVSFRQWGADLMAGLVSGITDKVSAIKSTILSIGEKVAGWFKGVLGIHSPSRVFMGFGGHITDGLALGIDRGGDAPVRRIAGVAARMASAVATGAPAIAAAASPAAGGSAVAAAPVGATYNITINAGAGAEGKSIARQVREEIEKIERDRAAARRSAYRDGGD